MHFHICKSYNLLYRMFKKLVKNIAVILILGIFFSKFLNARKQNFMKNARKKTFNRWGMLMQIILIKLTLYLTEKCQKEEKSPFNFLAKPPKNQTISIPYLLQAQPALVLQYLACYCDSTTMYRRNGNCVDHNHTDSLGAG